MGSAATLAARFTLVNRCTREHRHSPNRGDEYNPATFNFRVEYAFVLKRIAH